MTQSLLAGIADGLSGWRKAPPPHRWDELTARLSRLPANDQITSLARELAVVFGDGRAMEELKKIVVGQNHSVQSRRQAIRSLVSAREDGLTPILIKVLYERDVADAAVRGLADVDLNRHARFLIDNYSRMYLPAKNAVIEVLASNKHAAGLLLEAVAARKILPADVSPFWIRQMQLIGDPQLHQQIAAIWPDLRLIAADRLELIARLKKELEQTSPAASDLANGERLFEKHCSNCHRLFGRGGTIGPELTGAQRTNLVYWLENIVDPSAQVATNFRMSIVNLKNGRVLTGVIIEPTARTFSVQTQTEKVAVDRNDVESVTATSLSLMPDGLVDSLSPADRRDLFHYLMSSGSTAGQTQSSR